jgi:hypothetical protein
MPGIHPCTRGFEPWICCISGEVPLGAQISQLHAVEARLRTIGLEDIVLLAVAVVAMVSGRYL